MFIIKYIIVKIKESSLETYIATEGFNIINATSNLYCEKASAHVEGHVQCAWMISLGVQKKRKKNYKVLTTWFVYFKNEYLVVYS